MGIAPQTATGTGTPASLATPPTTIHPVRQASMGPPPSQRVRPQPSHQLSVSSAANATPPKARPQSGNLLQSPDSSFGARQLPRQQLSVKDSPAPGLPHQSSTAAENATPQGGANESAENLPNNQAAKPAQQSNPQHLLKPTPNKQVKHTHTHTNPCVRFIHFNQHQRSPQTSSFVFIFRPPNLSPPSIPPQLRLSVRWLGSLTCHICLQTSRVSVWTGRSLN